VCTRGRKKNSPSLFSHPLLQESVHFFQLLHGEQYTEVLFPSGESIPVSGKLRTTATVDAVLDKGKGCLLVTGTLTEDAETRRPLFKNQISIFLVGKGGFGGPKTSDKIVQGRDSPMFKNYS
jgi:3-hydroxyacyl-CoA dehydrogenase/3a,7a,12a-trihydroxy-5b-cholest-24-enoyl-CoA hydratase